MFSRRTKAVAALAATLLTQQPHAAGQTDRSTSPHSHPAAEKQPGTQAQKKLEVSLNQEQANALVEILSGRIVKRGEHGPQVEVVQKLLGVKVDRDYRDKLAKSLKEFQISAGLRLTAETEFSTATIARLAAARSITVTGDTNLTAKLATVMPLLTIIGSNNHIETPMRGEKVRAAQIIFKALGYHIGDVDGAAGQLFSNAVQAYKQNRKIPMDSMNALWIGDTTARSLVQDYLKLR